jgi:hypothetical protein
VLKKLLFVFALFVQLSSVYAQKIGIGAGVIYNLRTTSLGYDLRVHWQVTNSIAIVPMYNRFPSFNKVFEQYYGADVDFTILRGSPTLYILGNVAENDWFNYMDFHNQYAQPISFTEEVGIGARFSRKCLKPYLEFRYNIFWQEFNLRAGLLYFFGKCDGRNKGSFHRGRMRGICPAYLD